MHLFFDATIVRLYIYIYYQKKHRAKQQKWLEKRNPGARNTTKKNAPKQTERNESDLYKMDVCGVFAHIVEKKKEHDTVNDRLIWTNLSPETHFSFKKRRAREREKETN